MVKFLVVRFSSIGDIVLTTPVLRHLKNQVEGAVVHYLTKPSYSEILKANPYVDQIHEYNGDSMDIINMLRKEGFDYIIDLHHNARSARIKLGLKRMDFSVNKLNFQKWILVNFKIDRMPDKHLVDRYLETIEQFIDFRDEKGLDYFIPEGDEVPPETLPGVFRNGYVALAIGAQHETKKLPLGSLVSLCRGLEHPVVILGGKDDRDTGNRIMEANADKEIFNACGHYRINQSASLVRQAKLLITHDTGLMHIGAAFGKRIITIWGNTVPAFGMSPYRSDNGSVSFEVGGLSCRPCSKIGFRECPRGHFRCMKDQDLEGIIRTANKLVKSP
jgi:ADP-heptose:LPS heptosyltransferase